MALLKGGGRAPVVRANLSEMDESRDGFRRHWLRRETLDDRTEGELGSGSFRRVLAPAAGVGLWTVFERHSSSQDHSDLGLFAATASTAREQKKRSQEWPQAPRTVGTACSRRAVGPRARPPRKLQAPPGEPWRATPRGQRARASSTPTARGPSRGGRGACLPGGEAWGGMMSR